jgi:23S rRNA G2069 N7-methylase RlmK/C1962 C5-methylase RlmI
MSNISLYERAAEMDAAMEQLECAESEEEREQALDVVHAAAGELLAKVDRFAGYLSALESTENWAAAEIKRLQARQKIATARRQRLEQYAIEIMRMRDWESMEGETSTLKLKRNPPSVHIAEGAEIPAEYQRITQKIEPDKVALKVDLKAGREIPGVTLESSVSLRRS